MCGFLHHALRMPCHPPPPGNAAGVSACLQHAPASVDDVAELAIAGTDGAGQQVRRGMAGSGVSHGGYLPHPTMWRGGQTTLSI